MRIFGSVGIGPFRFGASSPLRLFRRRRQPRPYYIHQGCDIRHRRRDTADRCPNGRI